MKRYKVEISRAQVMYGVTLLMISRIFPKISEAQFEEISELGVLQSLREKLSPGDDGYDTLYPCVDIERTD